MLQKITVIGSGQMVRQIAMVSALHGYTVALNDSVAAALAVTKSWTKDYLEGRVAKGRLTREETDAVARRIVFEEELSAAVRGSDLVIEAIIEQEEAKRRLFMQLSELTAENTLLATNSSFINSSVFAASSLSESACISGSSAITLSAIGLTRFNSRSE